MYLSTLHDLFICDSLILSTLLSHSYKKVLHLELSCLHPFNPSVIETMRCLHRMYEILEEYEQYIKLLRIIVLHDEVIYGVVSSETAHSSRLLSIAYLNLSYTSNSLEHVELAMKNIIKSQHIMSVIYGRNHEVTMSTYLTLEMTHNRLEYLQSLKVEKDQQSDDIELFESKVKEEDDNDLETTSTNTVSSSTATSLTATSSVDKANNETVLLCPACGTKFNLPFGSRLAPCTECNQYCTELNAYVVQTIDETQSSVPKEIHPTIILLDSVLSMLETIESAAHQGGQTLPCKPRLPVVHDDQDNSTGNSEDNIRGNDEEKLLLDNKANDTTLHPSTMGNSEEIVCYDISLIIPKLRVNTPSIVYFDDNMKGVINTLKVKHMNEWYPCAVCSKPRASKRYVTCNCISFYYSILLKCCICFLFCFCL